MKYPIFKELDLSKHEGEEIALYFMEIIERQKDGYLVKTRLSEEEAYVVSNADFKEGSVVSFYGLVQNGKLVSQRYHIHKRPNTPYYLSSIGLGLFLIGFLRRWKFRLKDAVFIRRSE